VTGGSTGALADLGIEALRRAYASGLSPTDLVHELLRRIEHRGEDHVWIHRTAETELLARAAELEAGDPTLPLYGVPVAIKDNIDVAGLPTTAACPAYEYLPTRSAPTVQALVDAGAIVVGKTNLDQFATGLVGVRSPYGTPRNPLDPDLIPGGSSSGSAVAVAAGLSTLALGTDTAGSGRVPAALCGIVGLKPAPGWSSNEGVVPACSSFDCVSVFAATVADAVTAVRVMGGMAETAVESRDRPRIGLPDAGSLDFAGDGASASGFAATAATLGRLGATTEIDLGLFFEAGALLYDGALVAERYEAVGAFIEQHPDEVHPVTREIILGGRDCTAEQLAADHRRLAELKQATAPVWANIDVLVVPTVPTTYTVAEVEADPIRLNATLGRYNQFVNLLGLAAVVVPTGRNPAGRPQAVTLVAPPDHGPALLALAARIASRSDTPRHLLTQFGVSPRA
jgi:allophanate hydrolase